MQVGITPGRAGGAQDRIFTGMNQDIVAAAGGGVYDFPMREHSPSQGRWWTPDPAGLAAVDPGSPISWNRYGYVNGSPLSSADPLGLRAVDVTAPAGCHEPMPGGPVPCAAGIAAGVVLAVPPAASATATYELAAKAALPAFRNFGCGE